MMRICTICARGGSQSVKNKNLRVVAGLPLIAYSLAQARESGLFATLAVSSDSHEILAVARSHGADILIERPLELATDNAAKIPAIRHCVQEAERLSDRRFDVVVDLDATSPLRIAADIHGAVELLERKGLPNVITAAPARRSPYFNLVELDSTGAVRLAKPTSTPVHRRQDASLCFDMNASIYVWRRDVLDDSSTVFNPDTGLYIMPEDRSTDIDSELDLEIVEFLLSRRSRP